MSSECDWIMKFNGSDDEFFRMTDWLYLIDNSPGDERNFDIKGHMIHTDNDKLMRSLIWGRSQLEPVADTYLMIARAFPGASWSVESHRNDSYAEASEEVVFEKGRLYYDVCRPFYADSFDHLDPWKCEFVIALSDSLNDDKCKINDSISKFRELRWEVDSELSDKTDFLICNDMNDQIAKDAAGMGIPIFSEDDINTLAEYEFLDMEYTDVHCLFKSPWQECISKFVYLVFSKLQADMNRTPDETIGPEMMEMCDHVYYIDGIATVDEGKLHERSIYYIDQDGTVRDEAGNIDREKMELISRYEANARSFWSIYYKRGMSERKINALRSFLQSTEDGENFNEKIIRESTSARRDDFFAGGLVNSRRTPEFYIAMAAAVPGLEWRVRAYSLCDNDISRLTMLNAVYARGKLRIALLPEVRCILSERIIIPLIRENFIGACYVLPADSSSGKIKICKKYLEKYDCKISGKLWGRGGFIIDDNAAGTKRKGTDVLSVNDIAGLFEYYEAVTATEENTFWISWSLPDIPQNVRKIFLRYIKSKCKIAKGSDLHKIFGDGIIKAVRTDDGYILSDDMKKLCRETVYYIDPDGSAVRAAAQFPAGEKNYERGNGKL